MARNQRNGAPRNSSDPGDDDPSEDIEAGEADKSGNAAPMSLDDSPVLEETDGAAAKDVDGVPYCRVHHCRMIQSSGGKADNPKTYYKCKVAKCTETARIIKTDKPQIVPEKPQACPRCSKDGELVICERDPKSSTAAMVILKCPDCGWKSSAMAVPQLAAAHFARGRTSPPVEEIGAR
jgi:hypothetical protein